MFKGQIQFEEITLIKCEIFSLKMTSGKNDF